MTKNITKISLLFFSIFFLISPALHAQISVNDVILHFKSTDRPVHNLIVSNSSDGPLYVSVKTEEILTPGNPKQERKDSSDIIISPKRFSVQANGQRTVRLLLKKRPEEMEKVYRMTFSPQDTGFDNALIHNTQGRKTMLRILTGVGILIFVDPVDAHSNLTWKRDENKIVFHNSGNVHVRLTRGKACSEIDDSQEGVGCEEILGRRIYGNKNYEFPVAGGKYLIYTTRTGASGNYNKLIIPPLGHSEKVATDEMG